MLDRTKNYIPLNQIEGGTSVGTATISMPRNVRYHAIFLQYDTDTAGGATEVNMEAEISEVRVRLDQVDQRKASAAQIFDIYRTKGISPVVGDGTAPGFIPLFFSEPWRESKVEKEATAWGMQGVGNFTIEVDIANNAGQTPSLKAVAIVDEVQEAPKGIVKWKKKTLTINGTGDNEFNLVSEKGDSMQHLHFFESTAGDIDSLLIERDGRKKWQATEYQDDALISLYGDGYANVTGNVHVPFDLNHPEDVLTMFKADPENKAKAIRVQEVLATLNMGAAANVTLIAEMLGLQD